MSWQIIIPTHTVTARKDHQCDLCGYRIARGERYETWSGKNGPGGTFDTMRVHSLCLTFTADWDNDEWVLDHDEFRHAHGIIGDPYVKPGAEKSA